MLKILSCFLLLMSMFCNVYAEDLSDAEKIMAIAQMSGMSVQEVENELYKLEEDLELTYTELIHLAYSEYVLTAQNNNSGSGRAITLTGKKALSEANYGSMFGDYFYTPAESDVILDVDWNHGHAGIYNTTVSIVHAPGPDKTVCIALASDVSVYNGSKFARYKNSSTSISNTAVNFAMSQIGLPYHKNFINKGCNIGKFNCSQLVYCSYLQAGIILDNGSNIFVSPIDLVNDSDSYVYATY